MIDQWNSWTKRLDHLKTEEIPRCYSKTLNKVVRRELHTFVDASDRAFAAVVYLRTITENTIDVAIVAAKARVAPTKVMSIPRLELQAAVLGTRLTDTVMKEIRLHTATTTYWSDSKTVIAWINSEHRKYKQFVALRVSEILDSTTTSQWRWVDTKNNPADEATKRVTKDSIWVNGPPFLLMTEEHWPKPRQMEPTDEEAKIVCTIQTMEVPILDFIKENNFSSWIRLKRAVGIVFKYTNWMKDKKPLHLTLRNKNWLREKHSSSVKLNGSRSEWIT